MAFMWVLRWVWKIMQTKKAIQMTSIVPEHMLKTRTITSVLIEAWLLTGTSVWLEIAFEWEWKLSWEEYLQALVMVWLFKWVIKKSKIQKSTQKTKVKFEKKITQKEKNFNTFFKKNINSLKEWWNIKIWKNNITKKENIYINKTNWKSQSYSDVNSLLKDIKINRVEKFTFITKNIEVKLITNINLALKWKKIEFKKEWNWYSIFKNWKKIEFKELSYIEQNKILMKIFPKAKLDNFQNLFKDTLFTNRMWKISDKLLWKRKKVFNASIKKIREEGVWALDIFKNLTYKWFWKGGSWFTTGKLQLISLWAATYLSKEEIIDIISSLIDEDKYFFSIENAWNTAVILWQLWFFKKFWIIRAVYLWMDV